MTTGRFCFNFILQIHKYLHTWYLCIMEMLVPLLLFLNIMGIVSVGWFCSSRRRSVQNRVNMQEFREPTVPPSTFAMETFDSNVYSQ